MLHILAINWGLQVVSMKNNQLFSMVKPVSATIFVGVDGNLFHPVQCEIEWMKCVFQPEKLLFYIKPFQNNDSWTSIYTTNLSEVLRLRRNLLTQINIDFKRNRLIDKPPQQDSKKDLGQHRVLEMRLKKTWTSPRSYHARLDIWILDKNCFVFDTLKKSFKHQPDRANGQTSQ